MTPIPASAIPAQASGGIASPNNGQAKRAESGGTREKSAETRATSPARIMASDIEVGPYGRLPEADANTARLWRDGE